MAYDKVVDSSVLDANLSSVADAIREKAEISDSLAFPDGFVEAIAGIESGGGITVKSGSITPTENSFQIQIPREGCESDDGLLPELLVVYSTTTYEAACSSITSSNYVLGCTVCKIAPNTAYPDKTTLIPTTGYYYGMKSKKIYLPNSPMDTLTVSDEYITYFMGDQFWSMNLAGKTYEYICFWGLAT